MSLQDVIMFKKDDLDSILKTKERYVFNRMESEFADKVIKTSVYNAIKQQYGTHFALCMVVMLAFEGMTAKISGDAGGYTFMGIASNYNRELGSKILNRTLTFDEVLKHYYSRYYLGFNRIHLSSEADAKARGYTPLLSSLPVNISILLLNDAINPSYIGRAIRKYYKLVVEPFVMRGSMAKPIDGSVSLDKAYFLASAQSYVRQQYKTIFPFHFRFVNDWLPAGFSKFAIRNLNQLTKDITSYLSGKSFRQGIIDRAAAIIWLSDMSNLAKVSERIMNAKFSDLARLRDDIITLAKVAARNTGSGKYEMVNISLPSRPLKMNVGSITTTQSTTILPTLYDKEDKNLLGVPMSDTWTRINKYVSFKGSSKPSNEPGLRGLLPQLAYRLSILAERYYNRTGSKLVVNSGWRSWREQDNLRSQKGKLAAPPSTIASHQIGLAVDINTNYNFNIVLEEAKKAGLEQSMPSKAGERQHFTITGVYDQKLGDTPKGKVHKLAYLGMRSDGVLTSAYKVSPAFKLS